MSDTAEKGDQTAELENVSSKADELGQAEKASAKGESPEGSSRLQPPEWLANMSPEERLELEKRLKRKIDLRLMPAIIVMYILNYIDR